MPACPGSGVAPLAALVPSLWGKGEVSGWVGLFVWILEGIWGEVGIERRGELGGLHMFTTGSGEAKTEEMVRRRRVEMRVVGCMVLRGRLDGGVGGAGSGR